MQSFEKAGGGVSSDPTLPAGEGQALGSGDPPAIALAAPRAGQTVGRFVVGKQIGAGAMGLVLAAYDPVLDRKVAIKLLHPSIAGDGTGRMRLVREAQAMARLSHPNVVGVFEVGTIGEAVFLAMEHVEGTTLAGWLAAEPRSWRSILAAFVAAGRGLAAAHAAGVVHRDFKPDNVLVAADGRVRVGDFGVASRPAGTRPVASSSDGAPEYPALTHEGSLIGTPLYMSPEQHRGEPVDDRSDQFSFAVALYQALHGETPFAGESYADYADEVLAGRVRPAPRRARAPSWLRGVLLRALATDPDARFRSMEALLAALGRDPAVRRRRIGAGMGVAVLAGLAVHGVVERSGDSPCAASAEASRRSLAGAWDGPVRARVGAAFAASGRPAAREKLARVEGALDRRAGAIAAMRLDACLATHERGEQSAELLDRRVTCLDRRVGELRAMTGLLAAADGDLVDRSVEAVLGLGRVDDCADSPALLAAVPPPADPAARKRLDAAHRSLGEVDALTAAGKYRQALASVKQVVAATADLGYPPVQAEAMGRKGELELRMSDPPAARETFESAMAAAAAAHDDRLYAKSVTQLYHVTGYLLRRFAEAAALLPIARAAVARAGADPELNALMDAALGAVAQREGRYQDSADALRRALEATEAELGPDDPRTATAISNLGLAIASLGHYREALELHRRALAIREKVLGPEHPQVASSLAYMGAMLNELAQNEESLAAFRRALAVREAALGPKHVAVADALESIATVLADLGRPDEALVEQERANRLREAALGPDHLDVADSAVQLGSLLHQLGRDREAIPPLERALAVQEAKLGPSHPEIAGTLSTLALAVRRTDHPRGRALLRRALAIQEKSVGADHPEVASTVNNLALEEFEAGRFSEASALYRRALPIWEKTRGPTHPNTLRAVYYLARSELGAGHVAAAVTLFERALAGYESAGPARSREVLASKVALADALWRTRSRRDRARARRLVVAARETVAAAGRREDAAQLGRWLATHRE